MVIALLTVCLGRLVGCQILSFVFGVELKHYKDVLTVLLMGGSFFAFAVIEQVILTVMRRQIYLLVGFGAASLVAFFVSDPLVRRMGLMGAGWSYTIAAGVLFLIQAVMIWIFYQKRSNLHDEDHG